MSPKGKATRPTGSRLRETLFSILTPRLDGCRFVDLYAGTGAIGIEALSRGAMQVWFSERSQPALCALRHNLAALGISTGFAVEERGAQALLDHLAKSKAAVDVVYLDPPYGLERAYLEALGFLGSTRGRSVLGDRALVIAEHSSKDMFSESFGELLRVRSLKQGDVGLSFYELARQS